MTRDERQLIRMMNRSFQDKKQPRNIEVKDLSESADFRFRSDLGNPPYDGAIDLPKENESNICATDPEKIELFPITEDKIQKLIKECADKIRGKIKNASTLDEIKVDVSLDDMKIDEITDDDYKPLIQHFVLYNPWLPYEKDLRLTKFVIHQNNSVDLEFDIIFNKPPHLRNEPSDLNDPLNVLNRFYSLMGKSNADGNNIKCGISYTDAPDDALQKGLTLYSISGTITSMEILQDYGLGLRIKVKGEIIINDENRR